MALVTGLDGTGEDPAPSPQRQRACCTSCRRSACRIPINCWPRPTTALVLVRGFLPPGVQKGDKFDLEVQVPSRSETTSLRGGWLMETRLTEMAVLGGQIHEGHPWATGEGAVLVDPSADGEKDRGLLVRGRVLGGGTALKSRDLGLFIAPEDKSVRLAAQIGQSINRRFHTFAAGIKQGVANPRTDERIELKVHPRYKDNIARYMRVVRSIPLKESPGEQASRIASAGAATARSDHGAHGGLAAGSDRPRRRRRPGQGHRQQRRRSRGSMRPKRWPIWTTARRPRHLARPPAKSPPSAPMPWPR